MAIERENFSRECVFQGYYMQVSPHYLAAIAELRSGVSDGATVAGPGPYGLSPAEWAQNQDGGDLHFGFIASDIASWRCQTQVFAYMIRQMQQPALTAFGHPVDSLELYMCQLFTPAIAVQISSGAGAPTSQFIPGEQLTLLDQRFPGLASGNCTQTIATLDGALDRALATVAPLIGQAETDLESDQHNSVGQTFDQKAPQIMKQLMADFGLTDVQSGGILGNLGHESVGLQVLQESHPVGGGRGGYGWAQWTGPRRDQFQAWCQQNNLSMDSDAGNYGFLCVELKGSYKKALQQLKLANSLSVATETFCRLYEAPGVVNLASRMNWARRAMAAYAAS